jgi:AcrR family transcriptional regulator
VRHDTPATPNEGAASRSAPRSARREATRARVLAAATEVFAERGFHGASVEDICERAGFTRGAFYSNFDSKDDLVLALYEQHLERLSARVEARAARDDLTPRQILEGVLDVWAEAPRAEERWYLLQAEFTLHAIRDKEAGRAWAAQQTVVRDRLAHLVARIAEQHHLRMSVTPEEFIRLALAVSQGAMAQHLLQPRAVARGSLERKFLPLVLDAVSSGG